MSEREEHNELIRQMADRLRNHTEPYRAGAWEQFAAAYGARRRRVWPYWSAAALLVAVIGVYWLGRHTDSGQLPPQLVQQQPLPQAAEPSGPERNPSAGQAPADGQEATVSTGGSPVAAAVPVGERGDIVPQVAEIPATMPAEETVQGETAMEEGERLIAGAVEQGNPAEVNRPAEEAVNGAGRPATGIQQEEEYRDSRTAQEVYAVGPQKEEDRMGKWDLGVMVSPSLTSEAVNIGGGLTVAYRISDKFSIGSGISVAQLGVGENPNYQPRMSRSPLAYDAATPPAGLYFNGRSESAYNYKQEVSQTSSVVALDIPLDLRYEVAKGFYTSVGISYVAILNEQRTGHYVDKINVNTFANGHTVGTGGPAPTEFVYSSEKVSAKPLRGNGYAGFMNFSIGKKMPVSSKLFLSVEPYFKLPIGRLSKEEMDFTNGGIRIVTGF